MKMESVAKLSDSELRQKLEENGFKPGPITEGTRLVYEKKLFKLLNNDLSSGRGSSVGKDSKNRRRSTPARGNLSQTSTTIGFSSEDSESESASLSSASTVSSKQKTNRRRTLPASPLSIDLVVKRKPTVNSRSSKTSEASSFSITPSSAASSSVAASSLFYEESRNKSFENIEQVLSFPGSLTRSKLPPSRRTSNLVDTNFEDDFSDVENSERYKFNSRLNSLPNVAANKPQTFSTSSFLRSLRTLPYKRSSVAQAKLNFNHTVNGSNQMRNNFEKEFRTADDLRNATNYSQCISWLLLGFVLIFFVVLGMIYLGAKQKDANISSSLKSFSSHICKGFSTINCIEKENLLVAVKAARHLHEILAVAAGKYECMDGSRKERWMDVSEIKLALQNEMGIEEDDAEVAFANCVVLVKNHPEWGLKILKKDDSTDEIRALESTSSSKSFFCRFSQAFKFVFAQALIVILGIVIVAGGIYAVKMLYEKKKEREQKLYELVEKITETLWKHHDACQKNPDMEVCIPVVHVRDTLIPPAQRSFNDWQDLWNKAVKFVKENESRIRTETQRVAGEDFLVWRWLQPSVPEEFKRRGKTWQGQAFENSGSRNSLPFSPTPCLKIRNMFDPDMECDEDWPMSVRDAILEKCEGNNGIVHIHIDEPSKEGCVFMKCNSSESAGQAYKALHGWWFDGKLVTVKYLRLERYHERFPDSKYSTTTLKPSNTLRLSLQNPQNSSSSMLEHT